MLPQSKLFVSYPNEIYINIVANNLQESGDFDLDYRYIEGEYVLNAG